MHDIITQNSSVSQWIRCFRSPIRGGETYPFRSRVVCEHFFWKTAEPIWTKLGILAIGVTRKSKFDYEPYLAYKPDDKIHRYNSHVALEEFKNNVPVVIIFHGNNFSGCIKKPEKRHLPVVINTIFPLLESVRAVRHYFST